MASVNWFKASEIFTDELITSDLFVVVKISEAWN